MIPEPNTTPQPEPPALILARKRLDDALAQREKAAAALYRGDGTPVYTDTPARLAKLVEPVQAAAKSAEDAAAEVLEDVRGLRLQRYADFTYGMIPPQLEEAAGRRVFIADDMAAMPLEDAARRCEAVARNKADTVGAALHARYGRRRWQQEMDAIRNRKDGQAPLPKHSAALAELDAAVKRLEALAGWDANDARAALMEQSAQALKVYAWSQRAAVDGSRQRAFQVRL